MLLTLLSGFALSQAFRTTTAILAQGLTAEFGLSPGSLGAFAGLFGLSFGVAQLLMGVGLDLWGLRRTVLTAFPLAIGGAALSAAAPGYAWLLVGQLMIGVGCSPAFLACTLFIARHFPADRFAYLSGVAMGVGGLGLLFTGTPLAWLVQHGGGWRTGYAVLAVLSALSWLLIWLRVHEPAPRVPPPAERETWGQALRRFADAHETVEALDDLWLTMHLGLEVLDHHRFILRDMDFLLREYPALHAPLRELIGQRIATLQAALESLRRRDILQATDEQLASLALQTVLANTAWPSFEHLLPAAMPGTLRGSRAVAYHFLVMLSPYVDDASRQYLAYLRSRYAA